jgi:hypothetical protein
MKKQKIKMDYRTFTKQRGQSKGKEREPKQREAKTEGKAERGKAERSKAEGNRRDKRLTHWA